MAVRPLFLLSLFFLCAVPFQFADLADGNNPFGIASEIFESSDYGKPDLSLETEEIVNLFESSSSRELLDMAFPILAFGMVPTLVIFCILWIRLLGNIYGLPALPKGRKLAATLRDIDLERADLMALA